MDRRSFLRGLIATPAIITIPGLLMPVKAIPLPWAYVTCVRADGTELIQPVWDQIAPVAIYDLPWMGTNPRTADEASYFNPVVHVRGIEYPGLGPWGKPLSGYRPKGPVNQEPIIPPSERIKNIATIDEFKEWELFTFTKIDELKAKAAGEDQ